MNERHEVPGGRYWEPGSEEAGQVVLPEDQWIDEDELPFE